MLTVQEFFTDTTARARLLDHVAKVAPNTEDAWHYQLGVCELEGEKPGLCFDLYEDKNGLIVWLTDLLCDSFASYAQWARIARDWRSHGTCDITFANALFMYSQNQDAHALLEQCRQQTACILAYLIIDLTFEAGIYRTVTCVLTNEY